MHESATESYWRAGFTVVELMLVVVLIGVMAAIAAPRFPIAAMRADAGVRTLHGALQLAQRLAITRQADVVVLVDTAEGRLRVFEDYNRNGTIDGTERARAFPLDEGARFGAPPAGGVFGAAGQAMLGTNLAEREGLPSVVFRRNGSSSSDVELYLRAAGGRSTAWRAVLVAPSTGRAESWRLVDSSWTRM